MISLALGLASLVVSAHAQTDSTAKLPGAYVERDTMPLVTPARLNALPASERGAWVVYAETSRRARQRDRALLNEELRRTGATKRTRAPYIRESFVMTPALDDAFFRGPLAVSMGRNILSYQTPSGGWSKHVDMNAGPRQPGQSFFSENDDWHYIATIDNNATTSELEFLGRLYRFHPVAEYRDAFRLGVTYLALAQMPNGCWPQVYPLQGGYHDAVTFNDDAIANVIRLLLDIGRGVYSLADTHERSMAQIAAERGLRCLRDAQVVINEKKTIWAQQHDPLTLAPVDARSYEHASLAPRESVAIVELLMSSTSKPDAMLATAIHAAADWYRANQIHGLRYDAYGLTKDPNAPPLWARMAELGTNRPIFSNRDGVVRYDWNELTDRREGYAWFTDAPAEFLRHYADWARQHPRGS